jgi:hypothetical protein
MVARVHAALVSYTAIWGMGGAGFGIATGTQTDSCSLQANGLDFVTTKHFVDPAALASLSGGFDFYASQTFAVTTGLRMQVSTLGNSFSDGSTRWFSIPFPAGLLTLGFAYYQPR